MSPEQQAAYTEYREALYDYLEAKLRYLAAVKEAQRLEVDTNIAIFHRRQAG